LIKSMALAYRKHLYLVGIKKMEDSRRVLDSAPGRGVTATHVK